MRWISRAVVLNTRCCACSRSLAITNSSFGGSWVNAHHAVSAPLMVVLPDFFTHEYTNVSHGSRPSASKVNAVARIVRWCFERRNGWPRSFTAIMSSMKATGLPA